MLGEWHVHVLGFEDLSAQELQTAGFVVVDGSVHLVWHKIRLWPTKL